MLFHVYLFMQWAPMRPASALATECISESHYALGVCVRQLPWDIGKFSEPKSDWSRKQSNAIPVNWSVQ